MTTIFDDTTTSWHDFSLSSLQALGFRCVIFQYVLTAFMCTLISLQVFGELPAV